MVELKYTYALDKKENCVGIENARKGIEYLCPYCKGEMVVKEGSGKVKHYAHKTLTTEDGRSTTSPAAILSIVSCESSVICGIPFLPSAFAKGASGYQRFFTLF